MGYPVDRRFGLTLAFVDFQLLPLLLGMSPFRLSPDSPLRGRAQFESGLYYNTDHLEDDEDGSPEPGRKELEMDALRLAIGLELVSNEELTGKGNDLAQLDPFDDADAGILRATLAEQILGCYLKESVPIATVLREGAERLADSEWAQYCPGLLLIEVQALIEYAHRLPERDAALPGPDQLVALRGEAMRMPGTRGADLDVFEAMLDDWDHAARLQDRIDHADAVTGFYLNTLKLGGMTVTEVRSTAMLLTFAGLLEERFPLGPVHCLTAPSEG